ncbi:hypothetical protein AB3N58_10045 [Leptospira sp. WS60.C2]
MRNKIKNNKNLSKSLGYYIPNRFTLNVDRDLSKLNYESFTIFIHEYGHLLQNIFTVFGWYTFAIETFKLGIIRDIGKNFREYHIPFKKHFYNAEISKKIQSQIGFQKYIFNSQNLSGEETIANLPGVAKLYEETSTFFGFTEENERQRIYSEFLVDGIKREIEINCLTLYESMSYIIEKHYSLYSIPSPDFPYNIISLLFENTNLRTDYGKQLIIIYLSLLTPAPEIIFKDLFEKATRGSYHSRVDNELFADNLVKNLSGNFNQTLLDNITLISKYINDYCDKIKFYEHSTNYIKWLQDAYSAFSNQIIKDHLFFLRPILNKDKSNNLINQLDFDYFLLINDKNIISSVQNKSDDHVRGMIFHTSLFHSINYLFDYKTYSRKCPIIKNCQEKEKNLNCLCHPYKHSIKVPGETLCEYGTAAHLLLFHDIKIIYK